MNLRGPWSRSEVDAFLDEARVPVRLAAYGSSGHPVLATLWFVPLDGSLWCATQQSARIASHLERDPRCAFEVSREAPPYRGVRGQANARIDASRGQEVLRQLLDRYDQAGSKLSALLLERVESEVAIAIEPRSLTSWDFTQRMT